MDDAETTLSGSAFHILASAAGKAQLSVVDSLKDGRKKLVHNIQRHVLLLTESG